MKEDAKNFSGFAGASGPYNRFPQELRDVVTLETVIDWIV